MPVKVPASIEDSEGPGDAQPEAEGDICPDESTDWTGAVFQGAELPCHHIVTGGQPTGPLLLRDVLVFEVQLGTTTKVCLKQVYFVSSPVKKPSVLLCY